MTMWYGVSEWLETPEKDDQEHKAWLGWDGWIDTEINRPSGATGGQDKIREPASC